MGFSKSPAGVPWSYGTEGLMAEETRIYPQRLADEWLQDARRVEVVKQSGIRPIESVMVMAATVLWGDAGEKAQAASGRSGWTVRQVAALNKRAYDSARAVPFDRWADYVQKVVLPSITDRLPGTE